MSELTPASVKKLKVAELRSELSNLGLDTKGNKPVLVQRLLEAISGSEGEDGEQNAADNADDSTVTTEDDSQDENEKPEEVEKPEESEKPAEEAPVEKEVSDEPEPMETTTTETPTTNQPEVEQTSTKQEKVTEESASANDTDKSTEDSEKMEENKESKDEEKPSEETKQDEEQNSEPTNRKRGLLDTPTIPPQPGKVVDLPKDVDFDVTVEFSKVEEEPEAELDDTLVVLDKYTSDLFVKINPEATSCGTMKDECFIFMAGGARSTHGVTSGKVCYEVKVTEVHDVKLPDSEIPKNFVRVGWSVQATDLQLGEDEHSYGYDSTGKKCTNSEFSEFGQTFDKDDVITCYLDLESDVKKISFSKNGEDVGDAFELAEDIQDKAFFPHIYLKNSECEFNFGSKEEAWFAPKEGFSFIQNATTVRSTKGPSDKGECEVLMMIGLPASGKTTWVKKYIAENPDKNYNVLGTSVILDKMKLMGVARKQEYGGFNKHMDKAAKCLHRLFEIAPSKKRNYILDQTNVYMTAQSKKMKSFEGFKRKAIVCIPTQEALKERMEQKKNGGTELPYNAICDMKRNFFLPSVGDLFDEITYVDQDEEKSKAIVAEYAKEVPPQRPRTSSGSYQPDRKRPRYDDRSRHGGYGGGGGGGKWSGGHRDYNRRDDRRSGGFQPYNRRGGYGSPHFGRHGGSRGGFRDNRSGGGRGGYQGGGYHGSGSYNDRNRHGGYGGGNRNYGGGNKGFRGGSNYGNQRQQYNYSNTQQTTSYSPQQPQQPQQQAQQNYNYSQYYQQAYQQAYGQQPQQTTAATPQTQAYQQPQQQQQQQQYASYYQQGTYPQGYSYGY